MCKPRLITRESIFIFRIKKNQKTFNTNPDQYFKFASNDFRFYVNQALEQYFAIHRSLAADSLTGVVNLSGTLRDLLTIASKLSPDMEADQLKKYSDTITKAMRQADGITKLAEFTLKAVRQQFLKVSAVWVSYAEQFNQEAKDGKALSIFHCPKAGDGNGGDWLQPDTTIANPYFGKTNLRCGKLVKSMKPKK